MEPGMGHNPEETQFEATSQETPGLDWKAGLNEQQSKVFDEALIYILQESDKANWDKRTRDRVRHQAERIARQLALEVNDKEEYLGFNARVEVEKIIPSLLN